METLQLVYENGIWRDNKYGDEWELFDFRLAYRQGKSQVWDEDGQEMFKIERHKDCVIFQSKTLKLIIYGKSMKYL